jgi:hypothetical protein
MSQSSSPQTTTPSGPDVRQPLSPMDLTSEQRLPIALPRELTIPEFAKSLTKPVPLKEDLSQIPRKPTPLPKSILNMFHENRSQLRSVSTTEKDDSPRLYVIRDLSHRFTEASLASFLGTRKAGYFKFRVLSVNEQRGRFDPPLIPQQLIIISGLAIAMTRSNVTHLVAYAKKSRLEPLVEPQNFVLDVVFEYLRKHFISFSVDQGSLSSGGPKFGGGIGRKSGGSQPARYLIRSRIGFLTDSEWKNRGAVSVDSDDIWCVAKFSRIEIRDAACDSFIVGIELGSRFGKRYEIGLSGINGKMVMIENLEQPIDGVPPLRPLEPEVFFS